MLFFNCHMVRLSCWPGVTSYSVFVLIVSLIYFLNFSFFYFFILSLFFFLFTIYSWLSDFTLESSTGYTTNLVSLGLRIGFLLFICSEVMFFFGFFWSYFHNCLNPSIVIGIWPPFSFEGIVIDPFGLPLLNTVLLLSSGVSITCCHHWALYNHPYYYIWVPSRTCVEWGYYFTLFYGLLFLYFQVSEYISSYISINSTVYGSVFFLLTGFHGFHVILGLVFLAVSLFRIDFCLFSDCQHVGLECSIWYWHFVDVVWLFLYFFVYWYGYYV